MKVSSGGDLTWRRVPQKVSAGLPHQGRDPELFETALKSMNEVLLSGVVGPHTASCLLAVSVPAP